MINLNKEKEMISKSAILQNYNDIEIYRAYLTEELVIGGKPILSPLREEKKASFGFFIGESGEVCFKDFMLGAGDFVKFVQLKFGLTYWEALSKIGTDFGLDKEYICKKMDGYSFSKVQPSKYKASREDLLAKVTGYSVTKRSRDWKVHDIAYWKEFGISLETLKKFNVQPIDYIFINSKPYPADKYAYCFIEFKDGKETYKIYQPFNNLYKWINNHDNSVWQGWAQLPDSSDEIVITKSLKDVMALYEVCGLPSVSLQSENVLPKPHVFQILKERFKNISLLYDNDYDKETNWGKQFGDKMAREFGLIDYYIDDKYECKDFSDLIKKYGKEKAKEILEKETFIPF